VCGADDLDEEMKSDVGRHRHKKATFPAIRYRSGMAMAIFNHSAIIILLIVLCKYLETTRPQYCLICCEKLNNLCTEDRCLSWPVAQNVEHHFHITLQHHALC
jgi:hypothetical protein